MTTYLGRCHCRAIEFRFSTNLPPAEWSVRACQCTFCRAHGALSTSDPRGHIQFRASSPEQMTRYRFGLRTADFLICSAGGVYVGALTEIDGRVFGIINVRALDPIPADVPEPRAMTYEGETTGARAERRAERWSPAQDATTKGSAVS
jgi:hypothetical protein